jgi:hypothetical protein
MFIAYQIDWTDSDPLSHDNLNIGWLNTTEQYIDVYICKCLPLSIGWLNTPGLPLDIFYFS